VVAVAVTLGVDIQHLTAGRAAVQRATETVQALLVKVITAAQHRMAAVVVRVRSAEMEMREHLQVQVVRGQHPRLQALALHMLVGVVDMITTDSVQRAVRAVAGQVRLTEHQTVVLVQLT
jgi:hypothetical protein